MAHADTLQPRDQMTDVLTLSPASATAWSTSTDPHTPSGTLLLLPSSYTKNSTTSSLNNETKEGGALSPGAFVGIGLTVAVVFVVAVWTIMWTVRKRWRRNVRESNHDGGSVRRIGATEMGVSIPIWEVGRDGVREGRGRGRENVFVTVEAGGKFGARRGG